MGFLEGLKRRSQLRQEMARQKVVASRLGTLNEHIATVDTWIDTARKCASGNINGVFDPFDTSFVLKADEYAIASLQGIGLIRAKRAPTTYQGGYGGVSFPVFGRVRGHVGGSKGRIVQGDESLTIIETGDAIVTNQRMMFAGTTHSQEWSFKKVMACEHLPGGITTFAVSGRSTNSGIAYGELNASEIQYRIELALSLSVGTTDRYIKELEVERSRLITERDALGPVAIAPTNP